MRAKRATAICLALAALALTAPAAGASTPAPVAAGASAAARRATSIAEARRLYERARDLTGSASGARASAVPRARELTPLTTQLARALPSLPAPLRRQVRDLLARPTDSADPDGNSYPPAAPVANHCTTHFCIHWVNDSGFTDAPDLTDTAPLNGLPDYVDLVASVAEQVYATENTGLGWRVPKPDGSIGGNSKTDIYLADVGDTLFGYANVDPGQNGRRRSAFLVIDDDYTPTQFPGTTPLIDLEVTLAHEYNHVLQFGYDTFQDLWMMESSATWMEDQVYGSANDYLRYLGRWISRPKLPITQNNDKFYGSAVWNHWLANRYGVSIVRSAWQRAVTVSPAAFSVAAYDAAIGAAGSSDFSRDFALFSRDLPEWRTDTAFPEGDLYPDLGRQGSLPTNGARRFRTLDHTTYRLLRVPSQPARALRVGATVPRRATVALALVGRIGSDTSGTVVTDFQLRRNGGSLRVRLARPERFDRITAVLVNADASVDGFAATGWRYTGNDARFTVSAELLR